MNTAAWSGSKSPESLQNARIYLFCEVAGYGIKFRLGGTVRLLRHYLRSFAAACIALAGWAIIATIARRCLTEANGNIVHAALIYGAYLSHWSIAVTAVVFTALTVFPNARRAWWWVGQCLITNVAMTFGFWGAVPWKKFVVAPVDLQVLHALITPAVAVYWFILTDKKHVRFNDTQYWLILPLLYTVWMEAYGFFSGYYPYVELNPFYQGRLNVLTSIGEIFLSTALVSWLLGLVNQRPARSRASGD